jgi:FlaG/FlaF family flagellin (archaellin)
MKKINLFTVVFAAVISLMVFSCGNKTEKVTTPAKDTTVKKETVKEVETKNTVLEGTWISTDDAKSQLQAKANAWIELYEGEKPDTFKFAIGDTCLANANTKANPNGKYITVFDPDGNRCFFIVNVNDAKLELSYVGRGNTLTYKKKK